MKPFMRSTHLDSVDSQGTGLKANRGFTLIEIMITVAILAIIAAVALPNYVDYLTRSKLVEAKTNLSDMRTRLEQYFMDNRKYPSSCADYSTSAAPANTIYKPANIKYFNIGCALSDTAYTITAMGKDSLSGFSFSVNEANLRKTETVPSGWTKPTNCWVSKKSGDC